jgi:hypothetical protein
MSVWLALVSGLFFAIVPLFLGWRRTAQQARWWRTAAMSGEARRRTDATSRAVGYTPAAARLALLTWTGAGAVLGLILGSPLSALMGAAGGYLLARGGLEDRRQRFRQEAAAGLLRAAGALAHLLRQGRGLEESLRTIAALMPGPGGIMLRDLVERLERAAAEGWGNAIREWARDWDNPAGDLLAAALLAAVEERIRVADLIERLAGVADRMMALLARYRAAAEGALWQTRFVVIVVVGTLVMARLMGGFLSEIWVRMPALLAPALLGAAAAYALTMRTIRAGLSLEAGFGVGLGGEADAIPVSRLGRPL